MKKIFYRERAEEILRNQNNNVQVLLTEEKMLHLPKPIKNYLDICGYVNKPVVYNADVIWKNRFIKLKPFHSNKCKRQ